MKLAIEGRQHLLVERVQLTLSCLALDEPAADPGDMQETGADGLLDGVGRGGVAHCMWNVSAIADT